MVSDTKILMHIYFVNEKKKAGFKLKDNQTQATSVHYHTLSLLSSLLLCYFLLTICYILPPINFTRKKKIVPI